MNKLIGVSAIGLALAALALPGAAQTRSPNPTNRVHMQSKPAIVKIVAGFTGKWAVGERLVNSSVGGSGSGFIVSPDGYIVTNAHVVEDIKRGDDYGKQLLQQDLAAKYLRASNVAVTVENMRKALAILAKGGVRLVEFRRVNYVFLQSGSRYPFEIKSYGAPLGEGADLAAGKDVAVLKIEVKNAPTLRLANSDNVQVGDRVYVMGYPGAAELGGLGDQKSFLEPTTNDGSISAKKVSVDGAPIFQTNTNTAPGNSGGPAVNEKGEVVGLLTFGNREKQGFNFLVPTSTAMEFVRQAGVDLKPGPVDLLWREGLEHYWRQEYSRAKEKFTQVLALHSDHAAGRQLLAESEERIAKGEDRSGYSSIERVGLILIVAGVGLLVLILVTVTVVRGRNRRAASVVTAGGHSEALRVVVTEKREDATAAFSRNVASGREDATALFVGSESGKLVCTEGPLRGKEFSIGAATSIGRDPKRSQIVIQDTEVSGQHVWVGVVGGKVIARDCDSTNGTFLNGDMSRRITEIALAEGDVLTLGGRGAVKFTYKK